MFKDLLKNYIYPVATISGTIIGVGFFALPFIASKVGIWIMLAYFMVLGAAVVIIHRSFGEVSLKTPDFKRLPGFAKIHLGRVGEVVAYISTIIGLFSALLAYLIVGGEFLGELLSPVIGGGNFIYTIFYFLVGAVLIFFGIKAIARVEFWGLVLFFIILIFLFLNGQPFIKLNNFFVPVDVNYLFFPYGAVLFSLWGASLIPEAEEMLGSKKRLLKKIITISVLVPIFVYLFFILLILGITGQQTTESALTGLRDFLGHKIVSVGLLFGVITTFTSFIALGLTLKKVFVFDFKFKKAHAFIITCSVPLILFLLGLRSFIPVISFAGAVLLGVDGVLILLMYKKIGGRKIVIYPLSLVFIFGIIYAILSFSKII